MDGRPPAPGTTAAVRADVHTQPLSAFEPFQPALYAMPATEAWPYARASFRLAQTDSKARVHRSRHMSHAHKQPAPPSDPPSVTPARPAARAPRRWRLGIGWRLGLGMAAVAAV